MILHGEAPARRGRRVSAIVWVVSGRRVFIGRETAAAWSPGVLEEPQWPELACHTLSPLPVEVVR